MPPGRPAAARAASPSAATLSTCDLSGATPLEGQRRFGLGAAAGLGHVRRMSRIANAVPLGLISFAAYVALVVTLADHVIALHWAVQVPFFLLAGCAWPYPPRCRI